MDYVKKLIDSELNSFSDCDSEVEKWSFQEWDDINNRNFDLGLLSVLLRISEDNGGYKADQIRYFIEFIENGIEEKVTMSKYLRQ